MNKTIYIVFFESYCEFQAVFDEKFEVVDTWDGNDATWRGEYFNPFLKKLGIDIKNTLPKEANKADLEKIAYKKMYGNDPE